MNAKERFYSGLAKETIGKITSNTDNWTSFLRTMSRNYEFTYPEQVMIYAQRPNATFCKPYEDWNAENLFDHSHELTPKEKEIWMLFDRVYVAELLARDAFAKGAYMLGAEDREIMLK